MVEIIATIGFITLLAPLVAMLGLLLFNFALELLEDAIDNWKRFKRNMEKT